MSDVPGAGPGQEPSEEEVRAYLSQLRAAPADQVVAEVLSALLNAAQVKLGRRDGRLLIDLAAGVVDGARTHVPGELTDQVDQVLTQLRVAQVDAEREVAAATAQGHREDNDLGTQPAADGGAVAGESTAGQAPPAAEQPAPQQQAPSQQAPSSAASRLWVPGR